MNLPVGVVLLVLTLVNLREGRPGGTPAIGWPGLVLFSAALVLVVLGFLRSEALGWTSFPVLGMFVLGVLLLVAFAIVENRRGDAAMLDLSLLGNRTFLGLSLDAGLRLLPLTLVLFVLAAVTGGVVTRFALGLLVGTSILFIAVGMGLIVLVEPGDSWLSLLPSMIVMGIGMGITRPGPWCRSVSWNRPRRAWPPASARPSSRSVWP